MGLVAISNETIRGIIMILMILAILYLLKSVRR